MHQQMRRKERQIQDIQECKKIIMNNNLGVLSTIGEEGTPYGVPLNYFYDGEFIYFHSATEGHKIRNIRNNPKVSFCIVGDNEISLEKFTTKYESVIVFGEASIVDDIDEKIKVLNDFMKYLGREVDVTEHYKMEVIKDKTLIVKIRVESMTGKGN